VISSGVLGLSGGGEWGRRGWNDWGSGFLCNSIWGEPVGFGLRLIFLAREEFLNRI
jgi:hypothetical protein